jgi:hypothetical protein
MFKIEHLDAGFGWVDGACVFIRTGHLALQASGALARIDVKRLLHGVSSMN